MNRRLVLVGMADALEGADALAARAMPGVERLRHLLPPYSGVPHDLGFMERYAVEETTAFVAAGPAFLNLLRRRIYDEVKRRGFSCARLVHPSAQVDPDAQLGENVRIEMGALIGRGVRLGANVTIGAGAVLGDGTRVADSSWIGAGSILGIGSSVGRQCVLAGGVILADAIRVGDWCELGLARVYRENLAAASFVSAQFGDVVSIPRFGQDDGAG